MAICCEPLFSL